MMFFNESTMKFEGYDGTNWIVFSPEDWGSISITGNGGITYNYDFSNISYVDTLVFNLTDTSGGSAIAPRGAFVHPDGTYYFWADTSTDKVYRSEMTTAYDITSISGTPQTLSVSAKEGAASDVFLGDSGTKLYITGSISDKVHQYDLSIAYDLTTATFNQSITTRLTGFNESTPWSLHFKPDGTKMYIVGGSRDSVGELDLTTPWDISTATFSQSFSFTSQSTAVDAFTMSADGTKMFHGDGYNSTLYRYSLSTAWDVSTGSYTGATDLESIPNAPSNINTYGICFDTAGDRLYVTNYADRLHQFSLV
jgi:sugar lactone lactonase YvrE